ncbi:hypothetical protein SLS53_002554 [Cytospora paraplurivora]|uniref:AB hydrolase-1 domain-containing protein n=1 Tax=Cytospora paraplurivora TaxID=2898453 RepID=A0AAN9YIX8_9PEZI
MPFAQVNGKSIFYSWKPATRAGLTLYFIHGLGGSHSFWEPCIPGLVEAGFSCLAIDIPGFGQSPYNNGLEGIANTVDIPTLAIGSKATKIAQTFVRSLIQSSNLEAYMSLAQAIADAPVPAYHEIKVPLLCVAGQEDQVAHLEDLALIGDRHVLSP